MKPARLLVWMVALVALVAPSGMTVHAMAPAEQAALVDCADHPPLTDPCPDHGTAKHAAGDCCPLMTSAVALLPPAAGVDGPAASCTLMPAPVRSLVGRDIAKDPPPPRV